MSKKPHCDEIAQSMVDKLSNDTKRLMFEDLRNDYPDQASDAFTEATNPEDGYTEFAFMIFWSVQHQLMQKMDMSDEEIDERVYLVKKQLQ